ncbi:MAG: nucleotidyl transferase AbiEii/AbiGii toxin family protein [Elusimicrobiota bacterium]|nr:nucleotidyl transferase AbiEii/AbiGii toxin family protein [Elusimicrobiota bacterium]
MREEIRKVQQEILEEFTRANFNFALAGGTALELFYLNHRFSNDLDFFSVKYDKNDIKKLIKKFEKKTGLKIPFDREFKTENKAGVVFYAAQIAPDIFLKIDFIEDVFFSEPVIRRFQGVPVYGVEQIYYQKIMAIAGTYLIRDELGKERQTGRNAAKDVYDVFCLSEKIIPLHRFLKKMPGEQQRGMIAWYRNFSRQDLKLNIPDLDIYDKKFDSAVMIKHIDNEIKIFIKGVIG